MPDLLPIGGTTAGPALCLFRLILGVALLWKIIADHRFGMARFFDLDPKSLLRWRYERDEMAVKLLLSPSAFRVFYTARAVAVGCLLAGILTPLAAGVVAAWCLFEFTFDRKFNTLFLGLMCVPFVFTSGADAYLSLQSLLDSGSPAAFFTPPAPDGELTSWPQVAAVALMCQVYWSSTWYKAASRQFTSGDTLQKTFEQLASVQADLPPGRREYYFPDWFTRRFATADPAVARRWRLPSLATIAVEGALPLLLIFPFTWPLGALLGLAMHAAFTSILPKRLVPFGLASVGTYLLFLPQHTFVTLVGGLT
ncbi:hypothetical protein [Actinoplanes teichomyceticus]|uniref:HTTM domain-containing protein n=1 Tax=Actinoplanes teichomyceticus TaxID=1867 RepID=A0A561VLP7_ACTTI|nr:hypothetical protein [Actinoplanes teichomyceticus]TWG12532.1 hypothetical protein FHX34_105399 [Actinoplanes teichomyceticus]GIF13897.1 hypothetical protein Ate01nite_39290 [Actinoplanes teichomyceticus]